MPFLRLFIALTVIMTAAVTVAGQEKLTLDQLIAKHLASIGTAEARAAVKSRVAEGKSKFEVANAGGYVEGKATVVSQEGKSRMIFKYPRADYPGEDMLSDGNKAQVYGRPQRSALAYFIYNQCTVLLTEGLLEGTLSTAWPLLDPKLRSAKLTYNGLKTIDGQQLHELRYESKKRSDVDIRLYFDKENFRHVLTIAKLTLTPRLQKGVAGSPLGEAISDAGPPPNAIGGAGGPDVANARQQEIRYRIEERFSNFTQFDGMTFPTTFQIRYDLEGQTRQARHLYTNTFTDVFNNNKLLDPRNFEFK